MKKFSIYFCVLGMFITESFCNVSNKILLGKIIEKTKEFTMSELKRDYFKERRNRLVKKVAEECGEGVIILVAGFDEEGGVLPFRQNKDFYYFTGMQETGLVLLCYPDGREILYIPYYPDMRGQWVTGGVNINDAEILGVTEVIHLGQLVRGYDWPFLYDKDRYVTLLNDLDDIVHKNQKIFILADINAQEISTTSLLMKWFASLNKNIEQRMENISYYAHDMRRTKDACEIESLQHAIDITLEAHRVVGKKIEEGCCEYEIRAALEHVFLSNNVYCSFPSIVAAGINSTILHYTDNKAVMKKGDMIVVDIGAEYDGYAADITRTFVVGGKFSDRQKEIYDCVYETQAYIASLARPGIFLRNKERPEESLHHLALAFLEDRGYDRYFVHGIGHYLGLNVHDVGDYKTPLREGDVITIEPGIYIRDESLGVRIEDDYLITKDGCRCLSNALKGDCGTIQSLMASRT